VSGIVFDLIVENAIIEPSEHAVYATERVPALRHLG